MENSEGKVNREELSEIVRRIISIETNLPDKVTLEGDLNIQLDQLEKDVWNKFALDDVITFDQAKPAVKYIIARLRGDLDRHFSDKKFAALFREVDSNKNGKLERNELRQLV